MNQIRHGYPDYSNQNIGGAVGMVGVTGNEYGGGQYRNVAMNDQTDRTEQQMLNQYMDGGAANNPHSPGIGPTSLQ